MFRLCVFIRKYSSHSTNRPKLGDFLGRTLIFPVFSTVIHRRISIHPQPQHQHQLKSTWRFYHQLCVQLFVDSRITDPMFRLWLCITNPDTHQLGVCFTLCFFSMMIFNERAFCVIPHYRPYVSPLTTYKGFLSLVIRANHFWAEMHGCFGFIDKVHVFPHYGPYVSPCVVYNKNQPKFTLVVFVVVARRTIIWQLSSVFPLYRIHASVISHCHARVIKSSSSVKEKKNTQVNLTWNITSSSTFHLSHTLPPMLFPCPRSRHFVISQDAIQFWYPTSGCIVPTSQQLSLLTWRSFGFLRGLGVFSFRVFGWMLWLLDGRWYGSCNWNEFDFISTTNRRTKA